MVHTRAKLILAVTVVHLMVFRIVWLFLNKVKRVLVNGGELSIMSATKLEKKLLELRKKIIDEQPGFTMLARDSILADATIEQLCVDSRYFSCVDDIQIFGV